jgi:hypothetical protein
MSYINDDVVPDGGVTDEPVSIDRILDAVLAQIAELNPDYLDEMAETARRALGENS